MMDIISYLLPVAAFVVSVIFLVKDLNRKKLIKENDNKVEKNKEESNDNHLAVSMSLGMCFGVAIGTCFIGIAGPIVISYGICFGMLGGMIIGHIIKK